MVANHSNVQIDIDHGERFIDQVVEEGQHDPFGHLKILADNSYIVGSEDTYVGVWITTDLIRLLDQTKAIFADEKYSVDFDNGPSYLVVEPYDDNDGVIGVTHCLLFDSVEDPEKRLPKEETFAIPKQAWVTELINTAKQYHKELLNLNSELEDNETIRELREGIKKAEHRLDEYNDE